MSDGMDSFIQNQFLTALTANEDDVATRMTYADWLDDIGEHDEADRQRRWPMAKHWIMNLCDKYLPDEAYRQKYGTEAFDYELQLYVPYKELIERAFDSVSDEDDDSLFVYLGASESLCYDLRANGQEFWGNWSIITGISLEQKRLQNFSFSCGC
jgi:uncharacterized protein (TIGR02996 family)